MKKLYFLILLVSFGLSVNAQEFRVRYYDSATIWPMLRLLMVQQGYTSDSILVKRPNHRVMKLAHNQLQINFGQLLGKPTNLSGYGITDAYPSSNPSSYITLGQSRNGISVTGNGNYNSTTGVVTINPYIPAVSSVFGRTGAIISVNGDYNTSQVTESGNLYFTQARARSSFTNGTGIASVSTGVISLAKRQEPYSGTTNASGIYTVTYSSAYSTQPIVVPSIITSDPRDVAMVTASSTTGFTVQVQRRVDVIGLLPTYANRSGIRVDVFVIEP